jgi:acyl-CoA synthetase (AMP-forming)/AMP-acid ligase II
VLRVFGRTADFVKIGGESVDLRRLDGILDSVRGAVDAAVIAVRDERLGHVIHLAVASPATDSAEPLVHAFNERVLPFERIRAVHRLDSIPRSPLGKLLRARLVAEVT